MTEENAEAYLLKFAEKTVFGRLGGDETGIFLPGACDKKQIITYMKTLFSRFSDFQNQRGNKRFRDLYQDADEVFYDSKYSGKRCYSFSEEEREETLLNGEDTL